MKLRTAHQSELIQNIRKDNERALEALQKKAGIQVVEFEDDAREAWDVIAAETHKALVGEIYSQAFPRQDQCPFESVSRKKLEWL